MKLYNTHIAICVDIDFHVVCKSTTYFWNIILISENMARDVTSAEVYNPVILNQLADRWMQLYLMFFALHL